MKTEPGIKTADNYFEITNLKCRKKVRDDAHYSGRFCRLRHSQVVAHNLCDHSKRPKSAQRIRTVFRPQSHTSITCDSNIQTGYCQRQARIQMLRLKSMVQTAHTNIAIKSDQAVTMKKESAS